MIQRAKCAGFPYLEEERGESAGPPSPQEGETLDPEPVEPGEVAGTPVTSCNKKNNWSPAVPFRIGNHAAVPFRIGNQLHMYLSELVAGFTFQKCKQFYLSELVTMQLYLSELVTSCTFQNR